MARRRSPWTLLAALVVTLTAAPSASAVSETAHSADAFVDSIGVNVHMTYVDTAYRERSLLVDKLTELGVRHVRDGLHKNTQYAYDAFNRLADRGIGTTFILGDPSGRGDTLEERLRALRGSVLGAAVAVEGPNEYDQSGDPLWAPNLRDYQRRLHTAVKSDPGLAHLPVLAPSLVWSGQHDELGDLTDALDFGNKHPYPGGDMPEANLTAELGTAAKVSGARPVWATESGYHNALATTGGHRPISEVGAGTYVPRMYLEYFRRGIPRTFSYELVDQSPDPDRRNQERNFGLLRNDYSPKPSFSSLKNLTALLADRGPAQPVQPLELSIDGAPDDLRKLVLQKRDGTYYIVLWRAVRIWDPVARRALATDRRSVVLRVPDARGEAELYAPVRSPHSFQQAPAASGIPVELGADPIVVKLPPPGAAALPEDRGYGVRPVPPTLSVPPRQRIEVVLKKGVLVRCRSSRRVRCRATAKRCRSDQRARCTGATRSGPLLARGRRATRPQRTIRMRARLTPAGRRALRRARSRRGVVALHVRAGIGAKHVIGRQVRLRR